MKTEPIVAARVDFGGAVPRAPAFDDVYHPREGALDQARAVFMAGNSLPERWRGRTRFTILETGFGLGHNFLATRAAWRDDPGRCDRLHFVSLEKHPLTRTDLSRALAMSPFPSMARELIDAWPPLTPNLHALDFEAGRVRLLLGLGDAAALARELVAQVDAFFLDGFAPAHNADMWSRSLFTSLARLAAPGATAATWSAARVVREGLAAAGFEVQAAAGPGRKRDITLARFVPRFTPPRPPGRTMPAVAPSHAIVIGAGLAGAACARALARQGVPCTVLDGAAQPASQASGNPGALFHGTVGADDTPYTRLHRAAAMAADRVIDGAARGLLRLNERLDIGAMRAMLAAQRLPDDYVQALDAPSAAALAGIDLAHPAWLFQRGGASDPGALVRAWLAMPGITWRGNAHVRSIDRTDTQWRVLDAHGHVIADAPLLVLANARDALRLGGLPLSWSAAVRGQVSWLDAPGVQTALPRLALASGGYALPLPGGGLLFGATQQPDDDDPRVRESDHDANRATARRLLGADPVRAGATLHGRVAWRITTRDKLPLVGAVPELDAPLPSRRDAPRLIARRPGLFIASAFGARGLTLSALCGELVAAMATNAPWPLEADLVDAIDPARFALR